MLIIADVASGPVFFAAGAALGIALLLAVVLIEAVALRLLKWGTFWRSLRDSLAANAASALVGGLLGCFVIINFWTPALELPFLVGAWALSIVIEAGVLRLLSAHTWRTIWIAMLAANTASYLLMGPLFWSVLGGG